MQKNEKLKLQSSPHSSLKKLNFMVILLKIAKMQRSTFALNQDFLWNLVNSKYILQMILD